MSGGWAKLSACPQCDFAGKIPFVGGRPGFISKRCPDCGLLFHWPAPRCEGQRADGAACQATLYMAEAERGFVTCYQHRAQELEP